jgi:hypothetical protein
MDERLTGPEARLLFVHHLADVARELGVADLEGRRVVWGWLWLLWGRGSGV